MAKKQNPEEFYAKLSEQLEESSEWPGLYLYKFIVPADNQKIAEIEEIFDNMGAVIRTRQSSKGKYVSVSIEVEMDSPAQVIEKYKEVGNKVKDVISL